MSTLVSPELGRPTDDSLERVLQRHEADLVEFAKPGQPLTLERLRVYLPEAEQLVRSAEEVGIAWPDIETSVQRTVKRTYFLRDPEKADLNFAQEIYHRVVTGEKNRGFNNFPALLAQTPFRPDLEQGPAFWQGRELNGMGYAIKPYLHRAYVIQPEFMLALQKSVRESEYLLEGWQNAVYEGAMDPGGDPRKAALARGSRLAYGMLANLMRKDDLQRASQWQGGDGDTVRGTITNPTAELYD